MKATRVSQEGRKEVTHKNPSCRPWHLADLADLQRFARIFLGESPPLWHCHGVPTRARRGCAAQEPAPFRESRSRPHR